MGNAVQRHQGGEGGSISSKQPSTSDTSPPASSRPAGPGGGQGDFASVLPTRQGKEQSSSQAESASPSPRTNEANNNTGPQPLVPPLKLGGSLKQAFHLSFPKQSTSSGRSVPIPMVKLSNPPTPSDSNNLREPWARSEDVIKREKLEKYREVCSAILPYLFVGGQDVARSRPTLTAMGITHVVNCAGLTVDNAFPDSMQYLKLNMVDGKEEDILWFIHQVIAFIEDARASHGEGARVLVHCSQGVSRSCALVVAYIMWLRQWDFQQAFEEVKKCRPIASPNSAFICNLLEWHKYRVEQAANQGMVFRVAIHSPYDRDAWVPKLCRDPHDRTLLPVAASTLDPRGAFVIKPPPAMAERHQSPSSCGRLYVWRGHGATDEMMAVAEAFAQHLNRVEQLGCEIVLVKEGEVDVRSIMGCDDPPAAGPTSSSTITTGAAIYYDDLPESSERTPSRGGQGREYDGGGEGGVTIPSSSSTEGGDRPTATTGEGWLLPTRGAEDSSSSVPAPKLFKLVQPPLVVQRGSSGGCSASGCGSGHSGDSNEGVGGGAPASWEWEDMGVYDAEDLETDQAYLLHHREEGTYLWVGNSFTLPKSAEGGANGGKGGEGEGEQNNRRQALRAWVTQHPHSFHDDFGVDVVQGLSIEIEGEETDEFWSLLESGY